MYGFHKQRHPLTENYFQHESFRRGQNLSQIKRKPERKKKSEEQCPVISINKQFSPPEQFLKDNSQNSPSHQSDLPHPPIQAPSIHKKQKQEQLEKGEHFAPISNINNVNFLCEKAVLQNQILTKMHQVIMSQCQRLKKYRYQYLKESLKQSPTYTSGSQNNQMLSYLCQSVKSETMKLLAHLDCTSN